MGESKEKGRGIRGEFMEKLEFRGNYKEIARKSGVNIRTIEEWVYHGRVPSLDKAEAVLGAMGLKFEIVVKPMESVGASRNFGDW